MAKLVITTDLHFNRDNYEVVGQVVEQALKLAQDRNYDFACLGDLNDSKALLRAEWTNLIIKLFQKYPKVKKHILVGNHDLLNVRNDRPHSLEFLKVLDNVVIYDNNTDVPHRILDNIGWMPYKNDPMEIIKECVLFKEAGVDILFMHQGIEGALKNSLKKDEDGISSSYLSDFYVLTGHYHTKHTVGDNITYLGATLSHTFAESNEDKYIYIFDSYTGLEELIPSCARKHLTIQFDNSMAYIPLIEYAPHDLIRIVVSGPKHWVDSISKEDLSEIYGVNISVQKSYTTDNKEFSILPNSDSLDSILIKYAQEQSLDDTLKTDIIAVIKETCNEV